MQRSMIFVALVLSLISGCEDAVEAGSAAAGSSPVAGGAPGSAGSPNPGGSPASGGAGASSAGAGPGVGGTEASSGGGANAGAGGASASFTLLFRDDFDSLDTSRWQLMTHSWAGNLAKFAADPVSVNGGVLTLTLLDAPAGIVEGGETKLFLGAEVRSFATLTYGRVRARIRFAAASAVVSSLVTIYTPWPADNWNELDIESLGAEPSRMQFNSMVYTGPLPAPTTPVSPTQEPYLHELGFDSSADFHVYQIEWTPESAIFSVDDGPVYTWSSRIELMTLPQNVLLTIWASSSAAWAGPVTAATSMASASYDWIELYSYSGG